MVLAAGGHQHVSAHDVNCRWEGPPNTVASSLVLVASHRLSSPFIASHRLSSPLPGRLRLRHGRIYRGIDKLMREAWHTPQIKIMTPFLELGDMMGMPSWKHQLECAFPCPPRCQ